MPTIRLPADLPTCLAFDGAGLDTFYVTTATLLDTEAELIEQPLSREVFAIDVGAKGPPEARFCG